MNNSNAFERAQKVLVGGVNSPVRAFRSVGGSPYFVERGEGAYIYDLEAKQYVDMVHSYGASLLGHANPQVSAAIAKAAGLGATYGAPSMPEVLLAEEMCARVQGLEMVRLTNSGTEATMGAVRLARGITGRPKVIKFAGGYHGASDALLAEGGSGVANQNLSGGDGVPQSAVADTIVAAYNEVCEIGSDVACVIVEPVGANMGLVAPKPGFLEGLRAACDKAGALLIFDEVITGFRVGFGGASELFSIKPDMWCFGKVIGGGLPIGAFGASVEIMSQLAPLGPVYQGGTLSGNPVSASAGLAALQLATPDRYAELEATVAAFVVQYHDAISSAGLKVQVPTVATLMGVHFSATPVCNYADAKAANQTKPGQPSTYATFFHEMLKRGVALAPGAYEAMFVSFAHSPADLEHVVNAAHEAAVVALGTV